MKTIRRVKTPNHLAGAADCLAIGDRHREVGAGLRPVPTGPAPTTGDCPLQPPWKGSFAQLGGERQAVRLAGELTQELHRLRKVLRKCQRCQEYTRGGGSPANCPWRSRLQSAIQALVDEISQDWD